jgi:hypothetical protein
VGDVDLAYEALELPADPGLTIHVYSVEPASPSADALNLLASWAGSPDPASLTHDPAGERHRARPRGPPSTPGAPEHVPGLVSGGHRTRPIWTHA